MKQRITVSLPAHLIKDAELAVRAKRASSVSAYVAQALEAFRDVDALGRMLDEMDEEFGPPGPEAEAWAREVLGL